MTMGKKQKKIFVTRSSMPPFEEYVAEIKELWDTCWLTNMGAKHRELENSLKDYLGVDNISLMVNGHMALEMIMQAMHLTGEVITTPFTFASTTHAIARIGLTPVFADIREDDYTLDPKKIEPLITEQTSAILPVHVYGNICDDTAIEDIAKKHGLKVIYDAAHTFGERWHGKGVANLGDASILSFHATKVYNTIEGGAVCFHKPELKERLYNLKDFGIRDEETVEAIGANAKLDEFRAAMGLCNLRHIDGWIEKRRHVVERYLSHLAGVPGLVPWQPQVGVEHNYAYFPLRVRQEQFGCTRDDIFYALAAEGIHARKYFYPITSAFDCYRNQYDPKDTPVAYQISKEILTLPLFADLRYEDVDCICQIILAQGR